MTRREVIGDAVVYLGDARDTPWLHLPCHPEIVISDPPYSIPHDFGTVGSGRHGVRTLAFDWDQDIEVADIVSVFAPLVYTADAAFIFCGLRQATPLAEVMAKGKLVDKMACWVKPYPPPPAPGNWWPSAFELAVYGYRPGSFFGDSIPNRSNVFRYDALRHGNSEKNGHPTQKPIALLSRIVWSIAPVGHTVIDPFMGSGTTGVACLRQGRRFIGVESDERWFDVACRRIEAEARQPTLPLTPAELEQDSIGSFHAAIEEIGARVKAGAPVPDTGYFARRAK